MNTKNIMRKIKVATVIFRLFVILTLMVLLILVLNGERSFLRNAIFLTSFLFALLINYILQLHMSLPKEESIASTIVKNVNEAQRIISQKKYMMEKFFLKNDAGRIEPFNVKIFWEIVDSFIVAVTAACVGLILSFNPAFLGVYRGHALSIFMIFKLMSLSVLQVLLFGMAISCVLLKLSNFMEGKRK